MSWKSRKVKKKTCQIVDFTVPVEYKVDLKESKKRDKYQDFARELNYLLNLKVTVIPILFGVLETIYNVSLRNESVKTTLLLRSTRILRKVLEILRDMQLLKLQRKNHKLTLVWKTLNGGNQIYGPKDKEIIDQDERW